MSKTYFGTFEFPRDSSHDIHGISSSNTNTDGTQSPTVRSVGVCTNQHHSRIGVILQNDLSKERHINIQLLIFPLGLKKTVFWLLFKIDAFLIF